MSTTTPLSSVVPVGARTLTTTVSWAEAPGGNVPTSQVSVPRWSPSKTPQVPWVMYFNKEEQALHGAYWHDGFGFRRSHGCVNMSMTDAAWAFNWTQDQPEAWVYVYSSGEYKHGAPR